MLRSLIVLLNLTVSAWAPQVFALTPDDCATRLTMASQPPELKEAFAKLAKLGLTALLAEVYRGEVQTVEQVKLAPWQETVSPHVSKFGKKRLSLRLAYSRTYADKEGLLPVDLSSLEKREKFLWDVATSLFELQMEPWLWSKAAMFPRDEIPAAEDLSVSSIEYFARRMPQAWRDQYLGRAQILLRELYLLFMTFQELKPEDMMPARDPGRHWIIPGKIGPNVEDYNLLKSKGLLQFTNAVEKRDAGPALFKYYMAHLKRAMILATTIPTLFLLPYVADNPGFMESYKQVGTYEQKVSGADFEIRRKHEIERLIARIQSAEKTSPPDDDSLNSLKVELETLVRNSPGGVMLQPAEK